MRPDPEFLSQSGAFWANVRTISQVAGYSERGRGRVSAHGLDQMVDAMKKSDLQSDHLIDRDGNPTPLGRTLVEYFAVRARLLNDHVESTLMTLQQARDVFSDLRQRLDPSCPLPANKQRGDKAGPAYFTGIVNMLLEQHCQGREVDYDPQQLTTITRDGAPLRTLSRRVDGAFPAAVNPVAIWEIKEYYYTTTFGSRIADGIYETLLDGMELAELAEREGEKIEHLLMVDGHYTWWKCGRSYLCRIIDILHMGFVDEVLFGHEVVEKLPAIVSGWVSISGR